MSRALLFCLLAVPGAVLVAAVALVVAGAVYRPRFPDWSMFS